MSAALPVIVLGGGGHARVLAEVLAICARSIIGYTDIRADETAVLGLSYLGTDEAVLGHAPASVELVNAIGSSADTSLRRKIYESFKRRGFSFASIVHPSAVVSARATLLEGVQVMAGAVIQPGAAIGPNTIINTRASVDHDCRIGAHVHIAPGATLSGTVRVGDGTHIGTGASIIQRITIGAGCLVGAGAAVVRDVPQGAKVVGVPARVKAS